MTFYELIIKVHGEDTSETISIGGMHALANAARFLDRLAKAGEIPGVTEVKVYDTVTISASQLRATLESIGHDPAVVRTEGRYDVYLSEV